MPPGARGTAAPMSPRRSASPGDERAGGRRAGRDERLASYRRMRDFGATPEPSGDGEAHPDDVVRRFVVQRHRARALHYDLRFEIDGVLVSWAVPKGPTL